jgi:predicted kinase
VTARRLVLVTGPPGAGKTTIAVPLAAELGFTLLAKDRIKESLHDGLGQPEPDLAWSKRLGAASMELLWALAADAPSVVLEANFWPDDPRHAAHLAALDVVPVEVHCACPVEECLRRYAARGPARHLVHADSHELRMSPAGFERSARPLGLGPVIAVDTTEPVEIPSLATAVLSLLPAVSGIAAPL